MRVVKSYNDFDRARILIDQNVKKNNIVTSDVFKIQFV